SPLFENRTLQAAACAFGTQDVDDRVHDQSSCRQGLLVVRELLKLARWDAKRHRRKLAAIAHRQYAAEFGQVRALGNHATVSDENVKAALEDTPAIAAIGKV